MTADDDLLLPRPFRVAVLVVSLGVSCFLIGRAVVDAHALGSLWFVPVALLLGHIGVDAVTLMTHWSLDNYFSRSTPFIGKTVHYFREHHVDQMAMFRRDVVDNNFEQAILCLCWSVPPLLLHASPVPAALIGWGTIVGCFITTIHKHAHLQRPHPFFQALQRCHLLVDARHHAVHHRGENKSYGLAAGWVDVVFERLLVLRGLEALIKATTGHEPAHGDRLPTTTTDRGTPA